MATGPLLGIDLGTTMLKVCVFAGRTGRLCAQAVRRLPVRSTADGGREQSLSALDRLFREAVAEARAQAGPAWAKIAGIGLAAQGGSSILADRHTGRAHTPMILWNDRRTAAYSARLAQEKPVSYWRRHVLNDAPPAGLGRLRWLQERHPELFGADSIHIGAGEYLFFQLTGVWRQDAGHAIQIGAYNAARMRLDRAPFALSGLPVSFVAPLRRGHESAELSKAGARLLGVSAGIPVAGPYIDQEAGFLSAAGAAARPLQCSLGTAWVGNFLLPEGIRGQASCQLILPSPLATGRLVVLPLLAGNLTWDWALEAFLDVRGPERFAAGERCFRRQLLPAPGLTVFPWFTLPNPLTAGAVGAGAVHGLHPGSTREDLLRGTAAGMVHEFARVFGALKEQRLVDGVVLGGGASQGEQFRRLFAAHFAPAPVFWQRDSDLSAARGAVYAFDARTAQAAARPVPVPSAAVCDAVREDFERYCRVLDALYPAPPGGAAYCAQNAE